jgi:hypothetical protein
METAMDDSDPTPASGAAEAFDGLRQEIKLMRKALAALVDEQRAQPDYSETLGKIADDLSKTDRKIGWLGKRAALTLTPEEIAAQIKAASAAARAADHSLIIQTVDGLRQGTSAIGGWIDQARAADQQNRRLLQAGGIAGIVGLLLGLVLPMAALRTAPSAWAWPERGAAFVLGNSRWTAGERLLASADPARWRAVRASDTLGVDNHEAIQRCRDAARQTRQDQHCRIVVKPDPTP